MADILIDNETAPSTPAASKSVLWVDSTAKRVMQTDDGGTHRGLIGKGATTTTQALGSAADTYITNSFLTIPSSGIQAGQLYRWVVGYLQTATATTWVVKIRVGTAKTTSDTDISNTLATSASNAAASGGFIIVYYLVHTVGASGTGMVGYTLNAGVSTIQSADSKTSTTYDTTSRGGQFVGLSLTPSSTVTTINGVHAELIS